MTKLKNTRYTAAERNRPSADEPSDGVLLVDLALRPIALDCGAAAILREINGDSTPAGADHLPRQIAALLNPDADPKLARACVRLNAGNHEYSCWAFALESKAAGAAPMMALYLKRQLSLKEAVHHVGADFHLTDREQEALMGVTMGLTSKELATRMNISPNTVKAFLRLLMIKMGVPTRAGIVGKLFDQNSRTGGMGS